jgi:hypothetical protein
MPRIDTSPLPQVDLRGFTSDRAPVDRSVQSAIQAGGEIAETALSASARRNAQNVVSDQVDAFLEGRQAQQELSELGGGGDDLFPHEAGAETPDVVSFREKAAMLRDAAAAGEISTTELKVQIETDMRDLIRQNPYFAPEIQDAGDRALGRYTEVLNTIETSDSQNKAMQDWMMKQILGQAKELGIPLTHFNSSDPEVRKNAWHRYSQGMAKVEAARASAVEETLRRNHELWDEASQQDHAPRAVGGDMVSLKATLFKQGIPLDDPAEFRQWFDQTDADSRTGVVFQLQALKEQYTSTFNTRFPDLSTERQSSIMAPYMRRIDNYISLLKGELTAEALDFENRIANDRTLSQMNETQAGRVFTTVAMKFPNVPPRIQLAIGKHVEILFDSLLGTDTFSALPSAGKQAVNEYMKSMVPAAIAEVETAESAEVLEAFVNTTQSLNNANNLNPEELRGFFEIAANPVVAGFMTSEQGNKEVKSKLKSNFSVGVQTYVKRLNESAKDVQGYEFIALDNTQPDGMLRYMVRPGARGNDAETGARAAFTLNNNHAVHWNAAIKGMAHLGGGRTAPDYVTARGTILQLLMSDPVSPRTFEETLTAPPPSEPVIEDPGLLPGA